MAIKIRLQRIGAKKKAFYRIVVMEDSYATNSRVTDYLGTYDPHKDPPETKIDLKKVDTWISKGAKPSEKMVPILKRARKSADSIND